jgi:electron-transferring-flavoprotein dehydrogenase
MKDNRVSIGLLTGLSYHDPFLDPYDAFLMFKKHPFVSQIIKGGKVIEQGARSVSTGGYYTIPRLYADGALFAGGAAGMQNAPGLKGIHLSMKSGMIAAETIVEAMQKDDFSTESLQSAKARFEKSYAKEEIREGRNFAQALARPGVFKLVHLGAQYITGGRGIFDPMKVKEDFKTLKPAGDNPPTDSRAVETDEELFVDKLTGVYLSKTRHREDQPSHIIVHDKNLCINECYPRFKSPCTRFCPGNVYEIVTDEKTGRISLKLNPSNCLHCKTCDIKDPFENITWTCPEGGEGPEYTIL